jgi:amino acid transporter
MGRTGVMPAMFAKTLPGWGTPWVALLFQLLVQCVLMCGSFEAVLQANMVTYNLTLMLEFGACIKLRRTEPNLMRPYRIPCGIWGLYLLFAPPVILSVLLMCLCEWLTLAITALVLLAGVAYYLVQVWCCGGGMEKLQADMRSSLSGVPPNVSGSDDGTHFARLIPASKSKSGIPIPSVMRI